MTESPTAVTCRPETFGGGAAAELQDAEGVGDAADSETTGAGFAGWVAWDAAVIRWPSATCRSSPDGAAAADDLAMP
jgi:hypothetical protein